MVAINEVTNTPIIRPVATMDKLEIIEVAEQIDTFNLSIQPLKIAVRFCSQPKTAPSTEKVHQYEERLAIDEMIQRALAGLKMEEIQAESSNEKLKNFQNCYKRL